MSDISSFIAKTTYNTEIHTTFNENLRSIEQQREVILTILTNLAHIRNMGTTLNTVATNTSTALVSIQPIFNKTVKDTEIQKQLDRLVDDARELSLVHIETKAHDISVKLAHMLRAMPEVGSEKQIEYATAVLKAYLGDTSDIPTRPNSPLPIHVKSPSPFPNPIDEDDLRMKANFNVEAIRLKAFLKAYEPPTEPTPFTPPKGYTTIVEGGEKDANFWNEVVYTLFNKTAVEETFAGDKYYVAQVGMPNAPHFIGRVDFDNHIIASKKKAILSALHSYKD
ncbi:hypothetical protein AGABI2DRAFT_122501 [Agaricus bisporus var. bisporus H97]|uniref:hypothetical protein n=1 Tax=Agaricus bisporus var. bisporus (strain H97 / ATCC MYA-4626 / FGSC 10389) TaxID=936046 RepID=UPI00029F76B1|nr:hypothetical protein AGABI2DRAFT_122501 [Agaricus bisporus var. bisporus H97]EKV42933.1 hypothetical protein AGABI2DRAFT_122501 [Agaricus bisporus var. bisporus H97]